MAEFRGRTAIRSSERRRAWEKNSAAGIPDGASRRALAAVFEGSSGAYAAGSAAATEELALATRRASENEACGTGGLIKSLDTCMQSARILVGASIYRDYYQLF